MSAFWGITVSSGKKFKQQVQESFCVSGAAVEPLDSASGKYDENPVQLYLQQDNTDFLLCSLSPRQAVLQVPLNVRIGKGETVGFQVKGGSGKSKVHLTGYTLALEGISTPSTQPFKGQQKSILVTEPRTGSDAKEKKQKRVSILELEPHGEMEMESSDEGETVEDIRKKLFNGDSLQEESDDDDDEEDDDEEENSDSDMNEEELEELQQLKKKGKYNPETGGKVDAMESDDDDDDDDDLQVLGEDSDEEDTDDDDDSDSESDARLPIKELSKKDAKKSNDSSINSSPQKQGNDSISKNKNNLNSNTPKTPENQVAKLKALSSAGQTPMKTFTKGGVLVHDMRPGNGQVAKLGKMVAVYYSGRLKTNNKQFDASQSGPGFKFRLGKGEVIRGWDLGVEGMKVGGKRRLTIPAQLAYGKKGAAPDIPPNSTLVFDIELKNVS